MNNVLDSVPNFEKVVLILGKTVMCVLLAIVCLEILFVRPTCMPLPSIFWVKRVVTPNSRILVLLVFLIGLWAEGGGG